MHIIKWFPKTLSVHTRRSIRCMVCVLDTNVERLQCTLCNPFEMNEYAMRAQYSRIVVLCVCTQCRTANVADVDCLILMAALNSTILHYTPTIINIIALSIYVKCALKHLGSSGSHSLMCWPHIILYLFIFIRLSTTKITQRCIDIQSDSGKSAKCYCK